MAEHTPGAWNVIDHIDFANHGRRVVAESIGRVVAECSCLDEDANAANAHLIAAAPDLLEAAKQILADTEANRLKPVDVERYESALRAAVAKAEGK